MIVETKTEWNDILNGCGCCPMPICPLPVMDCESISKTFDCFWEIPDVEAKTEADACRRFLTYTTTYTYHTSTVDGSDDYDDLQITVSTYDADNETNPCGYYDPSVTVSQLQTTYYPSVPRDETYTSNSSSIHGGACTGSYTFTDAITPANDYSGTDVDCIAIDFPVTDDYTRSGDAFTETYTAGDITVTTVTEFTNELTIPYVLGLIDDLTFPEDANGDLCFSATYVDTICTDIVEGVIKSRARFRIPSTWQIPAVPFPGSYFKFTYDILEEPDGWDDVTPTVFRSFFAEDVVLLWTGPGTGDFDDPSWFTDWIEIDPPTVPGTRRIVNIRYECYQSAKFGSKPELTGEGVTLPDP